MAKNRGRGRWPAVAVVTLGALWVCSVSGCVHRRYTIRSNVPALAVVDGEEIGITPVSRSFTYYRDSEITLMADGYETLTVIQPIRAPWWNNYLTEFFTENLIPLHLRDEREFYYALQPATNPPEPELLQRAEGLRAQAQVPPPPRRRGLLGWLGFD